MVSPGPAALSALSSRAAACTACALHENRSCSVFSSGPADSRLVLLGEAPGAHENASGRPFCGRSGRLLDEALEHAGISRSEVYVCNAVKCRPPGNRPPTRTELAACRPFLVEQLSLVSPALVITLGASALRSLGVDFASLDSVRGKTLSLPSPFAPLRCFPTVHPAYVLRRRPSEYPKFCSDLRTALQLVKD